MKTILLTFFLFIACLHAHGRSAAGQNTNDGILIKQQPLHARNATGKFVGGENFMSPIGESDSGRRIGHTGKGGGSGGGKGVGGGGSASVREPREKQNCSPSMSPSLFFVLGIFFPFLLSLQLI